MKIYSTTELAEILKVHPNTVRREYERGNLQGFKVGSELKFSQVHIDMYLQIENFGKTDKEKKLEKEIINLKRVIENKNSIISATIEGLAKELAR